MALGGGARRARTTRAPPRIAGRGGSPTKLARTLIVCGLVHGSLLYGAPVSFAHVVANGVASARDALVVLAYCAALYGALSAACFLIAGGAMAVLSGGRRDAAARRQAAVTAGVAVFTFAFWVLVADYGLTYDELPFGLAPARATMLAVLAGRGLVVALASIAAARVLRGPLLAAAGASRGLATAIAATAIAAHVVVPFTFAARARSAANAEAGTAGDGARAFAPASAAPDAPAAPPVAAGARKVILLGLDGADWRVIDPLLAAGRLPGFARLLAAGSAGPLATIPDANSAVIWASIYTGKLPAKHGVRDFYRVHLRGMRSPGVFPVHRTFFKELAADLEPAGLAARATVERASVGALPIWEVLDQSGVSIGVVDGYYLSYPAIVPRDRVSYFVAYGAAGEYQRLAAGTAAGMALSAYVQPAGIVDEIAPALGLDELAWQASATLALLDRRPRPRFVSVYTRQPDNAEHRFWKWYQPEYFLRVRPADVARLGETIPRVYEELDAFVGEVLARADPETVVIVISDHGHAPTMLHAMFTQHRHGPPGIIAMAGGPVKKGQRITDAHVLDVFPTVLHLLGLPVPADADGRVLVEALESDPSVTTRATVPTYETLGPSTRVPMGEHAARNEVEIEKLRALGYVR